MGSTILIFQASAKGNSIILRFLIVNMLKIHKSAKICESEAKNGFSRSEKRKNCVANPYLLPLTS
jgi:hypothetical protein